MLKTTTNKQEPCNTKFHLLKTHPNSSFPKVHCAGPFHQVPRWILSGTFLSLKEHRERCASESLQTCVRNMHLQFIIICSRYSNQCYHGAC